METRIHRICTIVVLSVACIVTGRSAQAQQAIVVDAPPGSIFNLMQALYGAGFDHFNGSDDGSSLANQYLLSHLSMVVYSDEFNMNEYEYYLWNKLSKLGVQEIEVFGNNSTGADGAVITTRDSVIVAFRGTSLVGFGGGFSDWAADAGTTPVTKEFQGRIVQIHGGIWNAVADVYEKIWKEVDEKASQGKRVWLTGHSLGGASAALTAFRLQYEDGIAVDGLQTFGAPSVGDAKFREVTELVGPAGLSLADVTQRFSHYYDPAPTLFNFWGSTTYVHFGTTNTIFGYYSLYYDTPQWNQNGMWLGLVISRLLGIHMHYEKAMRFVVQEEIKDTGDFVLQDLVNDLVPNP